MSPGAIDRLVLVAPVGLKPETGEILDVFYYSPPQLRDLTVHDPTTIPEWDELFGRPPTPAEHRDRHAQPRDGGAAHLEALHAQPAAGALPAARDATRR